MSRIIVVYKSNYGSTKKYAEWIAEVLNADLYERSKITKEVIDGCTTIIYGGGVYAGNIIGLNSLLKKYENVKAKQMIVFAVGASPVSDETEKFINEALAKVGLKSVKGFYLRGALDEENMNVIHRTMMKMMRKSLSKKDESDLEYWAQEMVANGGEAVDWTDKKNINEMIKYIKSPK